MLILIVDDEKGVIDTLKEAITEGIAGATCIDELRFENAATRVAREVPDAVVLDLLEGGSGPPAAQATWSAIWSDHFCPVIIYSGFGGELQPPVPDGHPFVKQVSKGGGSVEQVVKTLQGFAPLVEALTKVRDEIRRVMQRVLRETAGAAKLPGTDQASILHAVRRHVAASMDNESILESRSLFSWEQYLVPPLGESPLTADIVRSASAAWKDPSAHRLILTPSCDLVKGRSEASLVVARCESVLSLRKKLNLPPKQADAIKRLCSQVLSQGAWNGLLPLPEYPGHVPLMVANLKAMEVVSYGEIGKSFVRVASIDSPFREQVAWSFLQTAGRPGMPDRQLDSWAQAIVQWSGSG